MFNYLELEAALCFRKERPLAAEVVFSPDAQCQCVDL